ncbi:MAG: dihydroorotase [Phycisphaerae bacterium]|nr:dihydroorotase [Phycisphaerae bacterium]
MPLPVRRKESHDAFVLRGGRIIDPASRRDEIGDLAIVDGRVAGSAPAGALELDASRWIVAPGFWDIHVHLREPGQTHKECIATGTAAAAAGGFTVVACMPNTTPPIDSAEVVRQVTTEARRCDNCEVLPIAAITRGREGREVTDFDALLEAGAVAFSDDGTGVEDDEVMAEAFRRAARTGAVLIQHCEYRALSAGGVMHAGAVSRRLGLPGLDPRSEEAMIERDLRLCAETDGRYHVAHISTARAVEMVRRAKREGIPVTAEVTPHHLSLTHEACLGADPNTKMHPPLRTAEDVAACREGLLDGTIDAVATDHAPHTAEEKGRGFPAAPPGIVGLETAIGVTAEAMFSGEPADWAKLVRWFTTGPAAVLGRRLPALTVGNPAEITILAPDRVWRVEPDQFHSRSRNTPFGGRTLLGQAVGTICGRSINFL